MIPVPPGSASRRRSGNGFTMSKLRKSIKPASMYFQFTGMAINAIIWPATSSITTNPGSLIPLSRATTVEGGMPIRVTSTETATAAGTCHPEGSHKPAAHQSAIVAADAQVPEPGWRCPMPKKVAMRQERRDCGEITGGALIILEQPTLQKRILDLKLFEPMAIVHVFAIQNRTLAF